MDIPELIGSLMDHEEERQRKLSELTDSIYKSQAESARLDAELEQLKTVIDSIMTQNKRLGEDNMRLMKEKSKLIEENERLSHSLSLIQTSYNNTIDQIHKNQKIERASKLAWALH